MACPVQVLSPIVVEIDKPQAEGRGRSMQVVRNSRQLGGAEINGNGRKIIGQGTHELERRLVIVRVRMLLQVERVRPSLSRRWSTT